MDQGLAYYRQYLAGDAQSFDGLIELYRENLIFFLLRYLPTVEDAEDAAAEAFAALLLYRYKEGKGASLKTYLFTLGRSKALNHLKKQKRQAAIFAQGMPLAEDGLSLEDRLCRDEERRQLSRAMAQLPAGYREVLHLLYFEELSLDETARVMKKKKKQVENISYRAKKALREKLEKEGF